MNRTPCLRDAADVRQAKVDQGNIRLMHRELLDAVMAGRRLDDDLHVRLTVDQRGDALADECIIVDAQHANR